MKESDRDRQREGYVCGCVCRGQPEALLLRGTTHLTLAQGFSLAWCPLKMLCWLDLPVSYMDLPVFPALGSQHTQMIYRKEKSSHYTYFEPDMVVHCMPIILALGR